MSLTRLGLVAVSSLFGLVAGCVGHRYEVHRAALVAPPTPPMWSGKVRPTGFSMGNSTVVWNDAPQRAPESESGLYVSSTQFDGNLHINLGSGTASLWLPMSYGLSPASFAAAPCLISRPDSGVISGGLGAGFSFPLSTRWYLGLSFEFQLASIPTHIVATCLDCPYPSSPKDKDDREIIPVLRGAATAGVDLGWVRLFGGLSMRNHPTNTQLSRQLVTATTSIRGDVDMGSAYGLAGVGAEFDAGQNVSFLVQAYQPFPLGRDDLIYGPIVGVMLDVHTSGGP